MTAATLRPGSLVLYKDGPARVTQSGRKKIEITRPGNETLSVRHKDVTLLHPGPLSSLAVLSPQSGEVRVAWELLAGSTTTLRELSELAYGAYTPATAWATWELVADGLYFSGTPDQVIAHTPQEVAAEEEARAAKAAEEAAWEAFVRRVEAGEYLPEDESYLREVEELAHGRYEQSHVLRALGRRETPEAGHDLLLGLGYWDETHNPHPVRLDVATESPALPVPPLPEEERRDLTHLRAFAIDDAGSEDPDDAVSLDSASGKLRLWVHVADVAALVPPDSPIDLEARARGASLYLPEGTVHMLPPAITERLALGLTDVSPALSFGIDFDEDVNIVGAEITPSWVRVERLSYRDAARALEDGPLATLQAFADTFSERRHEHGATSIGLPEVKVRVVDGEVHIWPLPNLRSRDLVREAMLAAGEAVAQFALEHDIPLPFTGQEPPEPIELPTPGPAGQYAQRRAFRRSQAGVTPMPHAGLGLDHYVQATSPLRRYLDLVVHQQLRAYLRGAPLMTEADILERIGASETVRGLVRTAERLSNAHWTMVYLLQNPGWEGEGIVVERFGQRSKLLIPALELETQMYLRHPVDLDDTVVLAGASVDLVERTAHFREK